MSLNESSKRTIKFNLYSQLDTTTFKKEIKGIIQAKMVKIINFLFCAQKVSSGMGSLRPKFLEGYRH